MSDDNQKDGYECWRDGDDATRSWFLRQWGMWPERADERCTTNLNFHYGAVLAYRNTNAADPKMSNSLAENVEWLDYH